MRKGLSRNQSGGGESERREGGETGAGRYGGGEGDIDHGLLFERGAECMLVVGPDGGVLDANLEARKALGRRLADLVAEGRDRVFDLEDPTVRSAFEELKGLGRFEGEFRLLRRGGEPFATEVSMASVGEEGLVSVVFRDLAGRERARRESEERFRITFDLAAVGMAHVAPTGGWRRVNRKLCEIVGYEREELLGCTFQDITHPEDLDADLAKVRQMLAGEIDTYGMEKRYCHKEGLVVWIDLTVSLVREPSGKPSYFIVIVDDIDERKREEQLRECLLRSLTPREVEVLGLLVLGSTNKAISRSMDFGMSSAKTHVQHIIMKLGVQSRSQAAARAVELGLTKTASRPETGS